MICKIDSCTTVVKARGMCNTHYHAWWVLQPKENRNPKNGRPKKSSVTYWGMHSRLKTNLGYASEHMCTDCDNPASDWSWDSSCTGVMYGKAKEGRLPDNPYCLHFEHYKARCTPCHMALDKGLTSFVEL